MTRIPIVAFALALVAGCDSEESSTQAPTDELAQADTDAAASLEQVPEDGKRWEHHGKRRHRDPASHLCADLGCTAQQQTEIEALFEHKRGDKHRRPDHSEANATLAQAFRGGGFSASDLEAYHQATKPSEDRASKHLQKMAQLHAILNSEQRNAFAETIETEGFRGKGRRGHGKEWKHRDGDEDPQRAAAHIERWVEHMCDPLSCTDEQVTKLTAILGQAKADKRVHEDKDDHRKALAAAMRSDSFDADGLRKQFEADEGRRERHETKADVVVAIHGVLDDAQREQVAAKIEEHGPRALMGRKGHSKGGKGRHRGGQRRRGGPENFEHR